MAHHHRLPAYLPSVAKLALTVAVGCAYILQPILDFVDRTSRPRSPVLDAAVAVVLVTLPATYLIAVVLLYIYITPAPPGPAAPGAAPRRRLADLACIFLAFALILTIAAFLFLAIASMAAAGSPPGEFVPT